jgi:phage shock protein PspC (stress-responsive transcriptional regulator)
MKKLFYLIKLISAILLFLIAYLTMAGVVQEYIPFNDDPLNELLFFIWVFLLALWFLVILFLPESEVLTDQDTEP